MIEKRNSPTRINEPTWFGSPGEERTRQTTILFSVISGGFCLCYGIVFFLLSQATFIFPSAILFTLAFAMSFALAYFGYPKIGKHILMLTYTAVTVIYGIYFKETVQVQFLGLFLLGMPHLLFTNEENSSKYTFIGILICAIIFLEWNYQHQYFSYSAFSDVNTYYFRYLVMGVVILMQLLVLRKYQKDMNYYIHELETSRDQFKEKNYELEVSKAETKAMYEEHVKWGQELEQRIEERTEALKRSHQRFVSITDDLRTFQQNYYQQRIKHHQTELSLKTRIAEVMERERIATNYQESKSLYLREISHDVRNQLSVVLGLSYVLMQQKEIYNRLPKRILETINVLHRNGGFITNLLNTVLEISMADAGRPQLIKQEIIKVSLWLDELIQIWNPVAQGKGVSFTVEQDITLPSYLLIDKMHVMQILNNLIGNAIKFSPPGKGVLLRLKRIDDAYWNLSVVDQGIGIDSFDRKRIFLPYEQADGTIQQKFGGTGLGLSTSRRLAELMNGTLLLHESPGGGCDFTVTLPMNKPKSRKELHHIYTDGTLIDSAKGKNILIIEDVEQPSLIWETYLVKMGMQAHVIHQIKDLDISFNLYQPDLVIIDLDMPKLAGFDAFQKVKHYVMQQHIPIMALSANGFEDHKQAVVKHGFHSLLVKPVSYYDLINEFNRLFYKQSLNEIQETMYLNAQV